MSGAQTSTCCFGISESPPIAPLPMPLKQAALTKYVSQLAEADYLHACVGLNAHRSAGLLDARNGYAEAFHISSLAEYREHYAQYCASR